MSRAATAVSAFPTEAWWSSKSASRPRAEVALSDSRRVEFVSKINGRRYALSVALPWAPPPPTGYGVLYVLDGYAYFGTAVEATRLNVLVPGVVVVGIGYPDDEAFADAAIARRDPVPPWMLLGPRSIAACTLERQYDLTLPASVAALAKWSTPGVLTYSAQATGGLDNFLRMIEEEAKPRVQAIAPIDKSRSALFGHSLGGLAVLRALFSNPGAFRTFIAASPSIAWADGAVLEGEAAFAAMVETGKASPRVLLTAGADEAAPPKPPPEVGADEAGPQLSNPALEMVASVEALARRLKRLNGKPGYEVADVVFAQQGHGITPWPSMGRAVVFAFFSG